MIQSNISLKELNWWKVGGCAEYFAAPTSIEALKKVLAWQFERQVPLHVISGGSNVLVQDGILKGLTLSMHELRGVESMEKNDFVTVTCLAGTPKSEVARIFLQNRLAPAIFLTGIPGDVGGGIVMNAGIGEARVPREFCEITRSFDVVRLDPKSGVVSEHHIPGANVQWEYRHSGGWQPGIIVRATLAWPNQPDPQVAKEVRLQTQKRVSTQPLDLPSCGSTFRNPHGHKAAQLIDQCGLKGYRVGGAQVSPKHANFIVNDQGAKAQDVYKIIQHVQATVFEKKGVQLKAEVALLGDWT